MKIAQLALFLAVLGTTTLMGAEDTKQPASGPATVHAPALAAVPAAAEATVATSNEAETKGKAAAPVNVLVPAAPAATAAAAAVASVIGTGRVHETWVAPSADRREAMQDVLASLEDSDDEDTNDAPAAPAAAQRVLGGLPSAELLFLDQRTGMPITHRVPIFDLAGLQGLAARLARSAPFTGGPCGHSECKCSSGPYTH